MDEEYTDYTDIVDYDVKKVLPEGNKPEPEPEPRGFFERMERWWNKDKNTVASDSRFNSINAILTPGAGVAGINTYLPAGYRPALGKQSNQVQQNNVYDYYDYNRGLLNRKSYPSYGFGYNVHHHGGYGDYGGHHSHAAYGSYNSYCEEDQVNIALLATTVLGIGIMWYTLWTKIMANGGRRRREIITTTELPFSDLPSIIYLGKNHSLSLVYYGGR